MAVRMIKGPGWNLVPDRGLRALERVRGIEPPLSAWEADVLPLNYTRSGDHCTG